MTIRQQQVESVLKRNISQVLATKVGDPRIRGMVSVTQVEVTADLRTAFVYVSVLPADDASRTLHGLRSAAGHIQRLALKNVSLRRAPQLDFRIDESLKKQAELFAAINEGAAQAPEAPAEESP